MLLVGNKTQIIGLVAETCWPKLNSIIDQKFPAVAHVVMIDFSYYGLENAHDGPKMRNH